jgi:hypothetical protein
MTTNTGGPAFPCHPGIENPLYDGMTLRDYFASKAMQACLQNARPEDTDEPLITWAQDAYDMADAMLEARKS